MAHILHDIEEIFIETALTEARDFTLPENEMTELNDYIENTFSMIAFAEAGEDPEGLSLFR
ncbi:hypothetical protein ACFL6N_03970 [Thermodesulfobacteriota bacterium]